MSLYHAGIDTLYHTVTKKVNVKILRGCIPYAGDTIVGCKIIRQTKIEPSINAFLRISDHRQSNTLHKTELFCFV